MSTHEISGKIYYMANSRCGEYWFLVPPANLTLDKQMPDHQVRSNTSLMMTSTKTPSNTAYTVSYMPTHIAIWLEGFKILGALLS